MESELQQVRDSSTHQKKRVIDMMTNLMKDLADIGSSLGSEFKVRFKPAPTDLTLDSNSSRVKDTLGHTSTPAFSVGSELWHYFPGHADDLQILLSGVYPILSWSSRLSLCTTYIPVYSLS